MSTPVDTAPIWVAAGFALGMLYFAGLRWNVRWFAAGKVLALACALQLLRFGAMAAVLGTIAIHYGPVPLLATTGGVLLGRAASLRRARRG